MLKTKTFLGKCCVNENFFVPLQRKRKQIVLTPKQTQTMEMFISAVESYNRVQKDLANKAREVIVKILTPRDMVLETCGETHITYRDRHGNYHCDLIEWVEVKGGHIIIHTENKGRRVQWPAVIDEDKIKIAETLLLMKKDLEEFGMV